MFDTYKKILANIPREKLVAELSNCHFYLSDDEAHTRLKTAPLHLSDLYAQTSHSTKSE